MIYFVTVVILALSYFYYSYCLSLIIAVPGCWHSRFNFVLMPKNHTCKSPSKVVGLYTISIILFHTYIYIYTYACMNMYICMHNGTYYIYIYIYIHITYIYSYIYICIYIYVYIYVCICLHIYIYTRYVYSYRYSFYDFAWDCAHPSPGRGRGPDLGDMEREEDAWTVRNRLGSVIDRELWIMAIWAIESSLIYPAINKNGDFPMSFLCVYQRVEGRNNEKTHVNLDVFFGFM